MKQLYQIDESLVNKTLRELAVIMHSAEQLNDDVTFLNVANEVNRRDAEDSFHKHYINVLEEIIKQTP